MSNTQLNLEKEKEHTTDECDRVSAGYESLDEGDLWSEGNRTTCESVCRSVDLSSKIPNEKYNDKQWTKEDKDKLMEMLSVEYFTQNESRLSFYCGWIESSRSDARIACLQNISPKHKIAKANAQALLNRLGKNLECDCNQSEKYRNDDESSSDDEDTEASVTAYHEPTFWCKDCKKEVVIYEHKCGMSLLVSAGRCIYQWYVEEGRSADALSAYNKNIKHCRHGLPLIGQAGFPLRCEIDCINILREPRDPMAAETHGHFQVSDENFALAQHDIAAPCIYGCSQSLWLQYEAPHNTYGGEPRISRSLHCSKHLGRHYF